MLTEYMNKHQGERIFILGTGPSLNKTPLEKLSNEYTMSMNKISQIYNQTRWRPDYYVFYDAAHYETEKIPDSRVKYVNESVNLGITSFITEPGRKHFGDQNNIEYFDFDHSRNREKRKKAIETGDLEEVWSTDITEVIYNLGSTVSTCAQIAHYMGFEEIYFVGCDLYKPSKSHLIFDNANDPIKFDFSDGSRMKKFTEFVKASSKPLRSSINVMSYVMYPALPSYIKVDKNHFSDNYLSDEVYNAEQMNHRFRQVHKIIKLASEKYSFEVYNATIGGYLEVYERVDLNSLLDKRN